VSGLDLTLEPERVRRFEVINGAGGRRTWSLEAKARILDETLLPGAVVSEVARRHGLTPQQVFGWRREARRATAAAEAPVAFVPAVVEPPPPELPTTSPRPRGVRRRRPAAGIELEVAGVVVRVGQGASEAQIAAVIRALKATA
jgi:transposase